MGIIGMYFLAKSLNRDYESHAYGYYSERAAAERKLEQEKRDKLFEEQLEQEKEYRRLYKAVSAVNGYEVSEGAEVPARVRKGVQRLFISKKRNIKHKSIVVLKADPNGVQMPELGADFSKYSVVGVLDDKTLCLFEKNTGDLLMWDLYGYLMRPTRVGSDGKAKKNEACPEEFAHLYDGISGYSQFSSKVMAVVNAVREKQSEDDLDVETRGE